MSDGNENFPNFISVTSEVFHQKKEENEAKNKLLRGSGMKKVSSLCEFFAVPFAIIIQSPS